MLRVVLSCPELMSMISVTEQRDRGCEWINDGRLIIVPCWWLAFSGEKMGRNNTSNAL